MEDDVPEELKRERNQVLLKLQERISREIYRQRIGGLEEVLVEGPSKSDPTRLTGRNRAQQIVVFPGRPSDGLEGKLARVRITAATPLTLIGEREAPSSASEPRAERRFVPLEELGTLRPIGI
jgi:tRNA-2-methylthio-N6-dimethylallyladenosine synthase